MCVEWCCTVAGVVESEEGSVVPNRGVGSAPVMPIQEHDVVEAIPEERVSERTVEQITRSVPVYRIKDRIAEQIVDVPVPQMRREMVEVVQLVPAKKMLFHEEEPTQLTDAGHRTHDARHIFTSSLLY